MEKDFKKLSKQVLKNVGGKDNITTVMHCYTRLRLNLKDTSLANIPAIEELDIIGVQMVGGQLQLIIGNDVNEVYSVFLEESGLQREEMIEEKIDEKVKSKSFSIKGLFSTIIDGIVGCMIPILPMLIASGIIKALVLILVQTGVLLADSPTILTLSFVADSAFYFMPVIIGVFAAKKFGANMALGGMLGAALIHPDFVALVSGGTELDFFGLPIYATTYSSSVVPIILSVWVMSYLEKYVVKFSPKSMRTLFEPVFTILIMIPLTFVVLAPLGAMFSEGFAQLLSWFYATFGIFAIATFCAIIPWVVMVGMHVGTVPISISTIASTGMDKLVMPAFLISNFTQGAACLAVGFKTKDDNLKSLAFSSAFSDIIPGISEPGMYGVTLRYKTPLWGAMIGAAVGGLYFGITGVGAFSFLPPNIFALAGYVGTGEFSNNLMNTIIGIVIGMVVTFIATMILYKPEEK